MSEEFVSIKDKPFLSVKEASPFTGIDEHKLREIAKEGGYDISILVENKMLFKKEALINYLNGCKVL